LPASNSVSFASSLQQAYYRLDYQPPHGNPPANTTIAAQDIGKYFLKHNIIIICPYSYNPIIAYIIK